MKIIEYVIYLIYNIISYIISYKIQQFHGTAIENHYLKIVDGMDIEIDSLGKTAVNKIMGFYNINKDDEFPQLLEWNGVGK